MTKDRKIFFVVASGGHDTDRHYDDTIKEKRTVVEAAQFLNNKEIDELKKTTHEKPYAVWGAVPGSGNIRTWEVMEPGDYVMIYKDKKIILGAEVAMKVHNSNFAEYLWKKNNEGQTWEYMFFLINEVSVDVPILEINRYLKYKENNFPHGFKTVEQEKVDQLLSHYGDLISLLQKLQKGEKLAEVDIEQKKIFEGAVEEKIIKAPTVHDEIQWRLIRLGNRAKYDVWVPKPDQTHSFDGNKFKDFVLDDFREAMDIPTYIKNIDTVWKFGQSIKSAFEIEHSTSIYSGLLRLADLRALAPNSNYPLFIVADREKKAKVFDQLRRPTFQSPCLKLDEVVRYLSYDSVREMDEDLKESDVAFEIDWLVDKAELVNSK